MNTESLLSIANLIVRLGFNTLVLLILVRWIYYPTSRRKDYLFTYFVLGSIIFMLCFMLESVQIEMGFAFGLFAILGIMRYRTNPMPIKEMSYLFAVISISIVNAIAQSKVWYVDTLIVNLFIVALAYGFERKWHLRHEASKQVVYEKIDNIRPENYDKLMADLTQRTGLRITRISIGKIDFLRDTAHLIVHYEQDPKANWGEDHSHKKDNDDDE